MSKIVKAHHKRLDKPPYKPGDKVVTQFFERQPPQYCTVTACYPVKNCSSGWLVDTTTDNGFVYKGRDSSWFQPVLI